MDWQFYVNGGLTIILFIVGWFLTRVFKYIDDQQKMIVELSLTIARDYVSKNDFNAALQRLENLLIRIEDKMDKKIDK